MRSSPLPKGWKIGMKRWIHCNIFDKHDWWWCGITDLYGQRLLQCSHCHRVKHTNYDANLVARKRKEIREAAFSRPAAKS